MNTLLRRVVGLLNRSPLIKDRPSVQLIFVNDIHNSHRILYNKHENNSEIVPFYFNVNKKEKETFLEIIRIYMREDKSRKGQLHFITMALKYMDEFGVNKDLETYKAIFDIFPKGKYIPENRFQILSFHYPKHQNTAIAILNKMEDNFVLPDYEMQQMILNTFGDKNLVIKKCWTMFYWLPKFAELNPWPVPHPTPTDPKVLAQIAMEKVSGADPQTKLTMYRTTDVPDAIDDTWIMSTMSQTQQELLAAQPTDKSLIVEGPFTVWVDKYCIDYFVLKGEPIKREVIYGEYDDISDLKIPFWERHNFKIPVNVHEQEDGVYYAMCATGTSSKDSLLSWIRCLQKTNPILEKIPVTFKLTSMLDEGLYIETSDTSSNVKQIPQDTDREK
ncbi:evolutionarily conserved signaling intermediate in Toll pathway, mitochondrial [Ceratina calcarata]|uniref:Evolutionarily conserved signaling intermediate in Toll pathway, mitochondrial n=1 Tax=Ceratina calcarata TaxID=156304 RepID=A0AAJ7IWR9_9HYME|nr:evolutionarily conserved signaling intermediate in Toll pathway, mitochondrial [Ceratina calcarata]